MIDPTSGRFQEMISAITKTNTGMLCIKKPPTMLIHDSFDSKTSNESMNISKIKTMERILGVHKINLLIVT